MSELFREKSKLTRGRYYESLRPQKIRIIREEYKHVSGSGVDPDLIPGRGNANGIAILPIRTYYGRTVADCHRVAKPILCASINGLKIRGLAPGCAAARKDIGCPGDWMPGHLGCCQYL